MNKHTPVSCLMLAAMAIAAVDPEVQRIRGPRKSEGEWQPPKPQTPPPPKPVNPMVPLPTRQSKRREARAVAKMRRQRA